MLGKKLAIDLGSSTLRVHVRGEGISLAEPSLVAADADGRCLSFGIEALHRAQRGDVALSRPIVDGQVADAAALDALFALIVNRVAGRQRIFKPDVMVVVASSMNGPDRRAVMEVATHAGARTTYLIDAPLAAAIGAGLPVSGPDGHLVVHLGGSTSDIAVISREGAIASQCLVHGGGHLTARLQEHVERRSGVLLDESTAEEAKREVGSAVAPHEERVITLSGLDRRRTGPGEVTVSSTEVCTLAREHLRVVATAVDAVLADTPAALLADVRERGGMLTGGATRLRGTDRLLAAVTGLPMQTAGDPENCAARGGAAAIENLDVLRRNFLYIR